VIGLHFRKNLGYISFASVQISSILRRRVSYGLSDIRQGNIIFSTSAALANLHSRFNSLIYFVHLGVSNMHIIVTRACKSFYCFVFSRSCYIAKNGDFALFQTDYFKFQFLCLVFDFIRHFDFVFAGLSRSRGCFRLA